MKHEIYALGLASVAMFTPLMADPTTSSESELALEMEEAVLTGETVVTERYYSDSPVSTATKLGLSVAETPQSISVISSQQIDDFGLDNVNHVLRYAPGVNVESVETDRTYFTARGFDITNFQVDGMGLPLVFGNVQGNLDSAIYEEVQVLRGANGLATGTGNPSATINLVRKRPTEDLQGSLQLTYGSWGKVRAVADVSVPFTEDGSVRGRIVAVKEEAGSYLDRYEDDRTVLYGILEADLTDRTLLTVGHTYEDGSADSPLWGALPVAYSDGSPTNYDVSTATSADWSFWDRSSNISFARLEQQLGEDWTLKAELSYSDHGQDSELFYMYGAPDPVTGLGLFAYPSAYESDTQETVFSLQLDGSYELFERVHEFVGGYSYGETDVTQMSGYGFGIGTPISVPLENWNGNYPKPAFTASFAGGNQTYEEQSFFAATRINASDRLKLILGARLLSGEGGGLSYGAARDIDYSNEFIPYAGFIYDLTDTFSVYGSYTKIFTPQIEIEDPAEGESYEIGVKARLFEGRAYASVAAFYVEQTNVAEEIPGSMPTQYQAVAGLSSEGFEAELVGEVFENFSLIGGYTFLQIKDADGDHTNPYTPKHLFKLSAIYEVPNTALTLGAAARWQSDIQGGGITQDDYVVFDLLAKYEFSENWSAAVNIYNVADEKYYNSLYWSQAFYGAPRSAEVSVSYSF